MSKTTDKEQIANLEQQLNRTTKELEVTKQKVQYLEQEQRRSIDRKLFVAKKVTNHFILGSRLQESLAKLLNGDISKDSIADVLIAILYRFTRIGIFAILISIVPVGILTIQTFLLSKQNDKIDRQNYRLDQQISLLEADRRSTVILESGNVLDAISKELADSGNEKDSLSNPLIGRIIALSRAMKPYKYLDAEADTIIATSISPERGHLLVAIHESALDSKTTLGIMSGANFRKADITQANLGGANLDWVDLVGAYLARANLVEAKLRGARLVEADLSQAYLSRSHLTGAVLIDAKLIGAKLNQADLSRANLTGANLTGANLTGANLTGAIALKDSTEVFLQANADTTGMIWINI